MTVSPHQFRGRSRSESNRPQARPFPAAAFARGGALPLLALLLSWLAGLPAPRAATASRARVPLFFQENRGQFPAPVRLAGRIGGGAVLLLDEETVLVPPRSRSRAGGGAPSVLRMRLPGARRGVRAEGRERLPVRVHHYRGADGRRWLTDVPAYARARRARVYPGIDQVFYEREGMLEYDFECAPGADPGHIRMAFSGARSARVDAAGDLVLTLPDGQQVRQHRPVAYQIVGGRRRTVETGYRMVGPAEAGFVLGTYDPREPLVIDPTVAFSTFLGGDGIDEAEAVVANPDGSPTVASLTDSWEFRGWPGGLFREGRRMDVQVTRLSPDGARLVFAVFLEGQQDEVPLDAALDREGSVWLTGQTGSADFPVTEDAYQSAHRGPVGENAGGDAFLCRLDGRTGELRYSSFLGGAGPENAGWITYDDESRYFPAHGSVAIAPDGSVLLSGCTASTDFPVTPQALQPRYGGGAGRRSYAPGVGDAFLARFSADGRELLFSSYFGGSRDDFAFDMDASAGGVVLAGATRSADFPVTPGAFQTRLVSTTFGEGFVARIRFTPAPLLAYATYLRGCGTAGMAAAIDAEGAAHVTGGAFTTFPTTPGTIQPRPNLRLEVDADDAFVAKLAPDGKRLVWSTFLTTGRGQDIANSILLGRDGRIHLAGWSDAWDLNGDIDDFVDAWIATIDNRATQVLSLTFIGAQGWDEANGLAQAPDGALYLCGLTETRRFPVYRPFQRSLGDVDGLWGDGFLVRLDPGSPPPGKGRLALRRTVRSASGGEAGSTAAGPRVNFGTVKAGRFAERTWRLTNVGTEALECDVSDPRSSFFTYVGRGRVVLMPGQSWDFRVRFAPWAPGRRRSSLLITSNSADPAERSIALRLVGRGKGSVIRSAASGRAADARSGARPRWQLERRRIR